jgi:hypothetical protein
MHVAHMPKATISTAVSSSNLNENHPLERAMNLIFMLVRGTGDSLICSKTTGPGARVQAVLSIATPYCMAQNVEGRCPERVISVALSVR